MYESQRDNLIAQSFNIEQAKFALETSKDTKETVIAMKYASAAMREDQKIINIDEIDVGPISSLVFRHNSDCLYF